MSINIYRKGTVEKPYSKNQQGKNIIYVSCTKTNEESINRNNCEKDNQDSGK